MKIVSINLGVLLLLVLLLEAGLRVTTAAPDGKYSGWFNGLLGLYPENRSLPMLGVVNWIIKTNQWGFRGNSIEREKTPGVQRIAMVGDSITDGFYVENEDTYPVYLETFLREKKASVEVLNAAHGGSTIDRQLAIFRDAVVPFHPDVVVLTFVTNDIEGLLTVSDNGLLSAHADNDTLSRKILRFLFVHTATGETILDKTLRFISPDFAKAQDNANVMPELLPSRYEIEGGDQYQQNAQSFMKRYKDHDVRILQDTFAPDIQHEVDRYLKAWDVFMDHAIANQIKPVFVYFPAYPQVYDLSVSMKIRDILRDHSAKKGVPFLDLTPALREQGAHQILHLAPRDFHLNPQGNQVIARALAEFMVHEQLVPIPEAVSGH
jgi:lysophospholipase L1-like esterase